MVSPESLGCVVQEFVRIFPRSGETFQDAGLQHVLGTVAFANLLPHARSNLFHQIALFSASGLAMSMAFIFVGDLRILYPWF